MLNLLPRLQHFTLTTPLLFALFILAICVPSADAQSPAVRLEEVASGLEQPTSVVHAGDGSGRLFITEKLGPIRVFEEGKLLPTPFLDLTGNVSSTTERGLLGLVFHPQYSQNGRLFIHYNDPQGDTVIAEYTVSDDPNVADAASERILLTIEQPYDNHKGGNLVFGPDGYLYIGMGDGGPQGDPEGNGQDLTTFLGKMLRIDVDTGEPYAIPEDNPFIGIEGAQPEIWAYGLRNPWRYSFDRSTHDLWIADVGQSSFEEVNVQLAASAGGENYGWSTTESSSCYNPSTSCDLTDLTLPVLEYGRDEGSSIIGGYVYRGDAVPELEGHYVFGDFGSGTIWSVVATNDGAYNRSTLLETGLLVVAFGEDEAGELYMTDFGGTLHRFVALED